MNSVEIPLDEVMFHPASAIDDVGRVFIWKGNLYRAIRCKYVKFYYELFKKKNIQELFSKGLVATNITHFSLDGYGLILQHQHIPSISYCMEWSSEMLRDAAMLICHLSIELYAKGLTFKDAHPWNILFDAGQPLFIDWGSIGTIEPQHGWPYSEFRDRFIIPLYLMSTGQSRLARLFMLDTVNRPRPMDIFRLLVGRVTLPKLLKLYRLNIVNIYRETHITKKLVLRVPFLISVYHWLSRLEFLKTKTKVDDEFFLHLLQTVKTIPGIKGVSTEWTNYQGPDVLSHQLSDGWTTKIRNIHYLLQKLRPETVLDIGCNKGWFTELAASQGCQVIAIDVDDPSINTLYGRVHVSKMPILPLVMDICTPTPPHGVNHAYRKAQSRLQADLVLALAITHHLVFKRGCSFEVISKQLAEFTKKWLIVEFVPPEDYYVKNWMNDKFAWYQLEGFTKSLRTFFKRIEVLDSSPSPRVLLLCER